MSYDVQDFDRDVLQRSREVPVLVDFWAPWCGPCKMLGPVLEKLAREAEGRWVLVKVNIEEHQALAEAFRISSIPNVTLFRDGKVVEEFLGFQPEAEIRQWLEAVVLSPTTIQLQSAAEHIDNGDLVAARALLEQVLVSEPQRAAAKLLLAEVLLSEDPTRAAALIDEIPREAEEGAHAEALKFLASAAQRSEGSLPEDPLKPRLWEGLNALRCRDWDGALSAFTDVVERRRDFAEGLAAESGKAIFRYLGVRHPAASKYYRRFSGALNA